MCAEQTEACSGGSITVTGTTSQYVGPLCSDYESSRTCASAAGSRGRVDSNWKGAFASLQVHSHELPPQSFF